ncbi:MULTISPECIES: response regulator transcription factor [unclassified Solwaraspora]|uniref:response regulator transcription factor n=1 Tax=unclassified Solwaraspora TaxID=2627926 RepID=UPI00259B798E|nr:LuxR C-terminal-related transcriptional regulator [Solwaraspora sp. WMMA2056]WJK43468.1 LuxR C-terminal-related transcriptional regulator [Solwaraspora sp. WMMA2056]
MTTTATSPAPGAEILLDLVDRMIGAADLDSYARTACAGIRELIPALSVSYNELNPLAGRAFALIDPDPGPGWFRRYQPPFEAYMMDNPLVRHALTTGDTRVLGWGDDGLGTVHGTTLDREFYQPNGIRSQLAVVLPAPPGVLVAFGVNRGAEGFDPAERRIFALLRPHLVHAYRAVQLRADSAMLGSTLGAQGWVVVLVDDDGRVTTSSPGAVPSAARYGLDVADGTLLPDGPLAAVRAVLTGYDPATPATRSAPLPVTGPAGTLEAVVVPSAVGPHVVLLRPRPDGPQRLAAVGLTPRQCQVAVELAAGATGEQIARQLGIAPATVRKHLEAVFARLGVRHRAAAVARLRSLLDGTPSR